jgi:DNA-binding MarR family transcriptional regulator
MRALCDRFHTDNGWVSTIIAVVQVSLSRSVSSEPAELARSLAGFLRYVTLSSDSDFLQQVSDLDLSLTQLKVLSHLNELPQPAEDEEERLEAEHLSVKQLAEQLGVSLPAASRAIDPLVKRRLVSRQEDQLDRRVKRVRLTARGEAAVGRLIATRLAAAERMLESFTPSEREKLADALAEILSRPEINRYRPKEPRA